jgi:ParB/RepB/Spo0J family partition protein
MKTTPNPGFVTEAIGVETIPTDSLVPNPHNPRMLFDRAPLQVLRESIRKVGILVPLTVYWSADKKTYVILDGQRRWMCAQQVGLPKVPVNVVTEPSLVQNIVTMFQIHKLREDWELMPTALKLELLMLELDERNGKKLAVLVGLDEAVVARCKKLLTYPKRYQDLMLDPDPEKRIKADFFIELYPVVTDRLVKSFAWFSRDRFTQRMLHKYVSPTGPIKAVTDFRLMKQHISNAKRAGKARTIDMRLRQFQDEDDLQLSHLAIPSASVAATARKLQLTADKLTTDLRAIEVDDFYGEEDMWASLQKLLDTIRKKLDQAGRRSRM